MIYIRRFSTFNLQKKMIRGKGNLLTPPFRGRKQADGVGLISIVSPTL